jgi:hypothetical protein
MVALGMHAAIDQYGALCDNPVLLVSHQAPGLDRAPRLPFEEVAAAVDLIDPLCAGVDYLAEVRARPLPR